MPTLICNCNQTMALDEQALGEALGEPLALHTQLCRRQAPVFQQAVQQPEPVLVACTQEQRLFTELAQNTPGALAPLKFVNIRETAFWSAQGRQAQPKAAALLAQARLPEPEPVPSVSYRSAGRLLIIGALDVAQRLADSLGPELDVTLFALGPGAGGGAQERRYPVLAGRLQSLTGWLGAFSVQWQADNPIDLDLCTRCNACLVACPEDAIGLDYQIDLTRCQQHRACVRACAAVGAIDFERPPQDLSERFDLVLDLRPAGVRPGFSQHALPQGYLRYDADAPDVAALFKLRDLVGEFEKPRFFNYQAKLCAHSRNEKVGCTACIDICSAEAISSDVAQRQIKVNPHLCVGCGACTSVCPSGALTYAYPRGSEQGTKLRTLLTSYAQAGGRSPALLLHSQQAGQALVHELGRAAQLKAVQGLPAHVIPLALWHSASVGLELWLSAVAYGAAQVLVLVTHEDAPQYVQALQEQMDTAQAILQGLGYRGQHFALLRERHVLDLDAALQALPSPYAASAANAARGEPMSQTPAQPARFALAPEKRATLELALEHLIAHAPAAQASAAQPAPAAIALPAAGALLGTVVVNQDTCTLCLSCVSACPAGALQDNPDRPELRFIEKNCVQCGLCVSTCPEQALSLQPRLWLAPERRQPRVLNQAQPCHCLRCGKPFGTAKGLELMLAKLAGHTMFQGAAIERLKMCGDCRVIDLYSAGNEAKITDL